MAITKESKVTQKLVNWLTSMGYSPIKVRNNHWIPDCSFLNNEKTVIATYEVKATNSYPALRSGLIQALEGYIYGFRSFLVIPVEMTQNIDQFLPYFPYIGIVSYSDYEFSIVQDAELPDNALDITRQALDTKANSTSITKIPLFSRTRKRRGTAVKVKSYSYIRNGKVINSPLYTRKRPQKVK